MKRTRQDPGWKPLAVVAGIALAALASLAGCHEDREALPEAEPSRSAQAALTAAAPETTVAIPSQHAPGSMPSLAKPRVAGAGAPPATAPAITRLATVERSRQVDEVTDVSFVGRHGLVAVATKRGVELLDAVKGTGLSIAVGEQGSTHLSADESLAAIGDGSGRVTLWDLGAASLRLTWSEPSLQDVAFSPDGKRIALSTSDGVVVRDAATGAEVKRFDAPGAFAVAFDSSSSEIVTTVNSGSVSAFDVRSGATRGGGGAQTGGTFGIAISPDGRWSAASAPDGHGMQVFDVHAWAPRQLVTVVSCDEHVNVSFSASAHLVFAWGGSHWVKAFEVGSWKPHASYHAKPGRGVGAAADDLSRVVVTKDNVDPSVVTVATHGEVKLDQPFVAAATYAMSPDGLLVAATSGGVGRVWSARTGAVIYDVHP